MDNNSKLIFERYYTNVLEKVLTEEAGADVNRGNELLDKMASGNYTEAEFDEFVKLGSNKDFIKQLDKNKLDAWVAAAEKDANSASTNTPSDSEVDEFLGDKQQPATTTPATTTPAATSSAPATSTTQQPAATAPATSTGTQAQYDTATGLGLANADLLKPAAPAATTAPAPQSAAPSTQPAPQQTGFTQQQLDAFQKAHGTPFDPKSSMDRGKMAQMTGQTNVNNAMPGGGLKPGQVKAPSTATTPGGQFNPNAQVQRAVPANLPPGYVERQGSQYKGIPGLVSNTVGRIGDTLKNTVMGTVGKVNPKPTAPPAPATQTTQASTKQAAPTKTTSAEVKKAPATSTSNPKTR